MRGRLKSGFLGCLMNLVAKISANLLSLPGISLPISNLTQSLGLERIRPSKGGLGPCCHAKRGVSEDRKKQFWAQR